MNPAGKPEAYRYVLRRSREPQEIWLKLFDVGPVKLRAYQAPKRTASRLSTLRRGQLFNQRIAKLCRNHLQLQ
ncbi:MAG: hypothetical protein AABM67_13365, partial [Acidobacteriota bacterium]